MDNRYKRHKLISGWNQEHLSSATAVIMGIGALGNEAARILAMSGIGNMILCDFDRVSVSNLSRSGLFREADVGRLKVEAAATALAELVPGINIQMRSKPLVQGVGLAELRDAHIVMGCLDSQSARLQLAGRCNLVNAPCIDGGTHPWGGEVRLYLSPGGACYSCSLTPKERAVADAPWSCLDNEPDAPAGATASSSVLVASWMSLTAIRYLMHLSIPEGTVCIDGSSGTTRIVQQKRDPECLLHSPIGHVRKIGVSNQGTVGELLNVLGPDLAPLAWMPVQQHVACTYCGFKEEKWGVPSGLDCPHCDNSLRLGTTLELADAPGRMKLEELGIAPREILAVRSGSGLGWIELCE